jgi:molecular chaperone GrpE
MSEAERKTENPPPPEGATPPPPPETPPPAEEDWAVRYKYLLADFENFRKRVDREREAVQREMRAMLLRDLLPLYESLDRAHQASTHFPEKHPFRQGLELVRKEWDRFLASQRIEPVARVGDRFRPDDHEAVGEIPADATHPDGTVGEIVQQGYRSAVGLLRTAKVLVARRPAEPNTDEGGSVTSPS